MCYGLNCDWRAVSSQEIDLPIIFGFGIFVVVGDYYVGDQTNGVWYTIEHATVHEDYFKDPQLQIQVDVC